MPPAPRDFDGDRRKREQQSRDERAMILGGETFYAKASVKPEVLTQFSDINDDTPMKEVLRITDDTILALLENVDHTEERYRAVRASEDDIVTLADLLEVAKWLVEVQTGRPTELPSASSGSPETTTNGTDSTATSSPTATPKEPAAST
jgi:hypothetical protein